MHFNHALKEQMSLEKKSIFLQTQLEIVKLIATGDAKMTSNEFKMKKSEAFFHLKYSCLVSLITTKKSDYFSL